MDKTQPLFLAFKNHLDQQVIGQDALTTQLLIALLTGGHALLEGEPGLAKTTAVKALASGIQAGFQRIQFTPDLMPADLTGADIFNPESRQFEFIGGPIFNQIILADEINRAPPKIQSALLEAMQERQVTINGITRPLDKLFLVLATQNPLEQDGTYPLPEAQLDRFLLHIKIDYPSKEDELKILELDKLNFKNEQYIENNNKIKVNRNNQFENLTSEDVLTARQSVANTHIDIELKRYIVDIVTATRSIESIKTDYKGMIEYGASPRASIALYKAASALAYLDNRDYVIPDDIQQIAANVLRHRIVLNFTAQSRGITKDDLITSILSTIHVP